jgi:toxin FitB
VTGYLLDTNVISELRKSAPAGRTVRSWLNSHRDTNMWLSVLVVGELRRGVALRNRRDPGAGAAIGRWLDDVMADFGGRILPITTEVAEAWAELSTPDPLPVVDGLIAATAIVHDLTVATRNVSDFARTRVRLVNPFEP